LDSNQFAQDFSSPAILFWFQKMTPKPSIKKSGWIPIAPQKIEKIEFNYGQKFEFRVCI